MINNALAIKFWKQRAQNVIDPKVVKVNSCNDFTSYDVNFILKFVCSKTTLLDITSGTGMTINKLYDKVLKIVAVEKFSQFTKEIIQSPNIEIYNEDILTFAIDEKFDLITMFGIVQYFNEEEVKNIYEKYYNYLLPSGHLIIKSQFGLKETVTISGYSSEIKTDYYSQYRTLDLEVNMLRKVGFKNIVSYDIYPPECNRWSNTHFYAIVAEK